MGILIPFPLGAIELPPEKPVYLVAAMKSFRDRVAHPWWRSEHADNHRQALLLARATVLGKWLEEKGCVVDGWYVARWDGAVGWTDVKWFDRSAEPSAEPPV